MKSKFLRIAKRIGKRRAVLLTLTGALILLISLSALSGLKGLQKNDSVDPHDPQFADSIECANPYITCNGHYMENSHGKQLDLQKELKLDPDDMAYTYRKIENIYLDARYEYAVVLTTRGEMYLFNSDLSYSKISDDVLQSGISFDGSRVFYVKETKEKEFRGHDVLYIYEIKDGVIKDTPYCYMDIIKGTGAISPNGRYFAFCEGGTSMQLRVIDLDKNCKIVSSSNYFYNNYREEPVFVSDDGKSVFCMSDTSFAGGRCFVCYDNGKQRYLGKPGEYDFYLYSRDGSQVVFSMGDRLFHFAHKMKKANQLEFSFGNQIRYTKNVAVPVVYNVKFHVQREAEFGGFYYENGAGAFLRDENMNRIDLVNQHQNLMFCYHDDDVTTFYYTDIRDNLYKGCIYSNGERENEPVKGVGALQITNNWKGNKLFILTPDYEIYYRDYNDDVYRKVATIDKDQNDASEKILLKYTEYGDVLYYLDGQTLYCYDPYTEETSVVNERCTGFDDLCGIRLPISYYAYKQKEEVSESEEEPDSGYAKVETGDVVRYVIMEGESLEIIQKDE